MLKKIFLILFSCVTAIALSQGVQGALGRGFAADRAGNHGAFNIDVRKVFHKGTVEVAGGMIWEARGVRLEMHAREFRKDGNAARFAGPARATFMTPTGPRTVEGFMHVVVVDRRNHEHPKGEPDVVAFRFGSPTMNFVYAFEGLVREGDIMVFERNGD